MMTWSTAAPAISAAFLASLVEVVEAFTIVLAVETAERLKGCESLLDAYAQRVFEAHDENR